MDLWNDLNARMTKVLEYPLLSITFSYNTCSVIFHPVMKGGLLTSGICRNKHQEIVHIPLKYQGLGITFLHTIQGILHVETLVDQPPTEGNGTTTRCLEEYLKLEFGIPGQFLLQTIKGSWLLLPHVGF